jgi:16S rRNA (guanine527-N7)-methyltransferase
VAEERGLTEAALEKLETLLALLAADERAPSAVRDPVAAASVHVADSLAALDVPAVRAAAAIADLGSGAGFPGLPLAVALPAARVHLVESGGRKAAWIAEAIVTMGLENAVAIPERVESWTAGLGTCDLVCARALAPLSVLVEYAAPLLVVGGSLVAWKGARDPDEERAGEAAARRLAMAPVEVRPVRPYAASRHRHLHVLVKSGPTPPGYPRRPGMARKRPLGV